MSAIMPIPNAVIVSNSSGDWEALYLNGVKVADGHSLSPSDIFQALEIPLESREIQEPDDVEGEVDFTPGLKDVKFVAYPELEFEDLGAE